MIKDIYISYDLRSLWSWLKKKVKQLGKLYRLYKLNGKVDPQQGHELNSNWVWKSKFFYLCWCSHFWNGGTLECLGKIDILQANNNWGCHFICAILKGLHSVFTKYCMIYNCIWFYLRIKWTHRYMNECIKVLWELKQKYIYMYLQSSFYPEIT